jgi:SPP1 gp7 family putative phage head morphogenesis protein
MSKFLFGPVPHAEAAKLIADKPVVVRAVFDKMLPEIRGRVFTITGVEFAEVLQTVRDRIAELPHGALWDDVKRDIADDISPFLVDETAEDEELAKQIAAAEARAELLLRVHGFQAYSACNEQMIQQQKDVFPYCEYITVGDGHVRPSHAALDGKIIPTDSPFWQTHTPPWDWGCRCQKVPRTAADVTEIQARQADGPPEEQQVLEGAALQRAVDGQVYAKITGPDGKPRAGWFSVNPREDKGAFRATPGDLRLPLDQLQGRYDADIWEQFESWAKNQKLDDGRTVWEWLGGKSGNAES